MRSWVVWTAGVWCLVVAALFTLSRGEPVSAAFEAALSRYSDIQAPVWHARHNTLSTLPRAYAAVTAKALLMFPGRALDALAVAGMDFQLAVALLVTLIRGAALLGLTAWLLYAGAPPLFALALAPASLCLGIGPIYGYYPGLAISGELASSLFLLATALLFWGRTKTSGVLFLAQLGIHPTSFVSWAPLFLALWLWRSGVLSKPASEVSRLVAWFGDPAHRQRAVLVALVVLPPAAGLLAGGLERIGILDMAAGAHYWDFVAARSVHSLFGGVLRSAIRPTLYLLLLFGVYGFSLADSPTPESLKPVNRLFAATGLGLYLTYLFAVETRWSVLANMGLPLRFDSLLAPLLLINLASTILGNRSGAKAASPDRGTGMAALAAAAFFCGLATRGTLTAVWAAPLVLPLASGRLPRLGSRVTVWVAAGLFLANLWVLTRSASLFAGVLRQLAQPPGWAVGTVLFAFAAWGLFQYKPALARRLATMPGLRPILAALVVVAVTAQVVPAAYNPAAIRKEIRLVASGARARDAGGPWADFLRWYGANARPGDRILNHPSLYLPLIGVPGAGLDEDNLGFSIYLPGSADELAKDLHDTLGLDIGAYARKGHPIITDMAAKGWDYARRVFIAPLGADGKSPRVSLTPSYAWAAEPPVFLGQPGNPPRPPVPGAAIVFENPVIRVYRLGEANVLPGNAAGRER